MAYGDKAEVETLTGVKPDDLGLADQAALDTWLNARLDEVTDWINEYTKRDFEQEVIDLEIAEVPVGINAVANHMCRNIVAIALASRQSPIVRVDDWKVSIADPEVFTDSAKRTLSMYVAKAGGFGFGMFVVRSERRQEEEEAS